MNARDLRIGDRVRIIGVPGQGRVGYFLLPETRRVFRRLAERKRPVRINHIDEYGQPWYECRFRRKDGTYEVHTLAIMDEDGKNWLMCGRDRRVE